MVLLSTLINKISNQLTILHVMTNQKWHMEQNLFKNATSFLLHHISKIKQNCKKKKSINN